MKFPKKSIKILKLVLNHIAEIYLYFFAFYIICLILSCFFVQWKLFFNWTAFHISVIVLGILSLFSDKFRKFIFSKKELLKKMLKTRKFSLLIVEEKTIFKKGIKKKRIRFNFKSFLKGIYEFLKILFVLFFSFLSEAGNILLKFVFTKLKRIKKSDYLKIGIITAILIFSLIKGIKPLDFLVLGYALISILFVLDSRISVVVALLLLTSCPVLIIFKKTNIAEALAVYAYYFLVITAIVQIIEYKTETKHKLKEKSTRVVSCNNEY